MRDTRDMSIVIMAGGGGTRLWPLSLQNTPKQFLDLGTGKTLIEHAYDRAIAVTDPEAIYVATAEKYKERVQELLPNIPESRIFLESTRRDTTAAFVQVCLQLVVDGKGDEPTTFLWSDHVFTNESAFIEDLKRIPQVLADNPNALLVVGHSPLNANTTLGYFKVDGAVGEHERVFHVEKFTEKPDKERAEEFIAAGDYYWNLGYFSLRPKYLLEEIVRVSPELSDATEMLRKAIVAKDEAHIRDAYAAYPKAALEFTFVEKTKSIIAITGDYGWSDVGNWKTVKEIFGAQGDHAAKGHHIHVDSENNYIYNTTDKVVSLIGMKDAIVVVTNKAVLVTDEEHSHQVKQVVERIEEEGKSEYL